MVENLKSHFLCTLYNFIFHRTDSWATIAPSASPPSSPCGRCRRRWPARPCSTRERQSWCRDCPDAAGPWGRLETWPWKVWWFTWKSWLLVVSHAHSYINSGSKTCSLSLQFCVMKLISFLPNGGFSIVFLFLFQWVCVYSMRAYLKPRGCFVTQLDVFSLQEFKRVKNCCLGNHRLYEAPGSLFENFRPLFVDFPK